MIFSLTLFPSLSFLISLSRFDFFFIPICFPLPAKMGGVLTTLVEVVCAILLPPLAVFLVNGIGTSFFVNILLTLLGWIPGAFRKRRKRKMKKKVKE